MLTDLERKTLRILFNFSNLYRRMPTMKELEKKTGACAVISLRHWMDCISKVILPGSRG